jgi:hypothetical protein
MTILSIDVGIKNLAFCLFGKSDNNTGFQIIEWNIINIGENSEEIKCCEIDKFNECNKPAKFLNLEFYNENMSKKKISKILKLL